MVGVVDLGVQRVQEELWVVGGYLEEEEVGRVGAREGAGGEGRVYRLRLERRRYSVSSRAAES